ncbi:Cytochrome c, mono-and diheme variants [Polaromonas sp. OV174]|uniref:cytochrome c n=1 Tax=Polaromonas sp. OV174 TaxID=1855300 RepID=UPI0008EBB4A2|nr:cytochrome c [Polaromonas sp. OV174]SFC48774.1 Cytochrome c, mono-and diheme variants [Polaromonas sp. OV174]
MKRTVKFSLALGLLIACAAALVWFLNLRDEVDLSAPVAYAPSEALVARGAYLARAGNCMTCHTAKGGESYAGGRGIATPFGTVYTSNLTPDNKTGIGSWSSAHFWRAMHNGRSKDGRLLYPAFPYTDYTQVTREDSDALYAYLHSLPAVAQPNHAHTVRFPYNSQAALAVWRALYFSPGVYQADSSRDAEWNRGAYLVKGLGHCAACHTERNALGASNESLNLAGGLIPMQNWYAPSLTSPHEAGVADWDKAHIVSLLKTGVSPRASVTGPMADVVLNSTQYLNEQDLGAMAQFLKTLPAAAPDSDKPGTPAMSSVKGAKLYEQHCAQCHGKAGEGVANAYPALAGNRAVTMKSTANLVQIVLNGGYAPSTAGNPRPYGMPPFVLVMNDADMAAVLTHVRGSWGNQASEITPFDVSRLRANRAP